MQDYSEHGEQLAILDVCTGSFGTFLDVGAYTPTCCSNTRALIERGWSGVLVEPSPEAFLSLLKTYGNEPRLQLVCAAVSVENGFGLLHATARGLSTLDNEHRAYWAQHEGGYYGRFWTPLIIWEDIFAKFGRDWDFVNIDAEGTSAVLFTRLMETSARPGCICVEHDDRFDEIRSFAGRIGYKVVLANHRNVVMARL